jgi:hypothetical protein
VSERECLREGDGEGEREAERKGEEEGERDSVTQTKSRGKEFSRQGLQGEGVGREREAAKAIFTSPRAGCGGGGQSERARGGEREGGESEKFFDIRQKTFFLTSVFLTFS